MGKTREPFIQEGIQKYVRYLGPYAEIELRELKEEKIQDLGRRRSSGKRKRKRYSRHFLPEEFLLPWMSAARNTRRTNSLLL